MTCKTRKRFESILFLAALVLAPAGMAVAQPAPTAGELDQIVAQFKQHGLAPVGGHGFLQTIHWVEQNVAAERSSVTLVAGGARSELKIGSDLALDADLPLAGRTEAPLVFIGYGLSAHSGGPDDFAGQNLQGKVLVALDGAPAGLSESEAARIRQANAQQAMERSGAVGLITISVERDGTLRASDQGASGFYIDAKGPDAARPAFSAAFNPAAAETLFDRSGHSYAEVAALARGHWPLTGFALNKTLKADVQTQKRSFDEVAAIATLAGADPTFRNDYVVVEARLTPAETASTIAGLLPSDGAKLRRPILYAAFRERNGHNATARTLMAENISKGTVAAVFSIRPDGADRIQLRGAGDSSLGTEAQQLAAAHHLAVAPGTISTTDDLSPADAPLLALSRPDARAGAGLQAGFDTYAAALVRHTADAQERPRWSPDSALAPPQAAHIDGPVTFVFQMPVGRRGQELISGTARLDTPMLVAHPAG